MHSKHRRRVPSLTNRTHAAAAASTFAASAQQRALTVVVLSDCRPGCNDDDHSAMIARDRLNDRHIRSGREREDHLIKFNSNGLIYEPTQKHAAYFHTRPIIHSLTLTHSLSSRPHNCLSTITQTHRRQCYEGATPVTYVCARGWQC